MLSLLCCAWAGFGTVQEMFQSLSASLEAQLDGMVAFIQGERAANGQNKRRLRDLSIGRGRSPCGIVASQALSWVSLAMPL